MILLYFFNFIIYSTARLFSCSLPSYIVFIVSFENVVFQSEMTDVKSVFLQQCVLCVQTTN